MDTTALMLHILQCSLNGESPTLPQLTSEDWTKLYWLARKHGVVTILYDVISQLPAEQQPTGDTSLSWPLSAERTRYHFHRQEKVLESIRRKAAEENIPLVIVKGMGLAKLYPNPSSRACGDIDLFFPHNYAKGNAILGCPDAKLDGKHAEMAVDGVTVENHLRFLDKHYLSQRRAERFIQRHIDNISPDGDLPPMANLVYLLMHTVSHLTAKIKLPLRNFLDWGIFIRANQAQLDPAECHRVMRRIGMNDAFNMLTLLAGEFIGTDLSHYVDKKINPDDVNRMRQMILTKGYMPPLDRSLPLFKRISTRISRNKERRWLYRYLPSNTFERTINNIIRIFYKG